MDSKKAAEILGIEEGEDLLDALELAVFEVKNHFLSKPLLYATASSRLKKINHLMDVEHFLNTSSINPISEFKFQSIQPSDSIQNFWGAYMQSKQQWKTRLAQTNSIHAISELIQKGLAMELYFTSIVPQLDWNDEMPVFGQEPDAMEIQKALSIAAQNNWLSFEEIYENKNKLPASLLIALKRLSLLPKYLKNEQ